MQKPHFDILLTEMTALRKAHALVGEQPGVHFNIFRILGMESAEVSTHSQFLAELLNPKGKHGLGDVFLRSFLAQLNITGFDTLAAKVIVEHYIGPISETQGGRIDLLLSSGGQQIIIENKIYARDQKNQLLRYFNSNPSAHLFYLTLDGADPDAESTGNGVLKPEQYTCISYATDILKWLETCHKESASLPVLRETIFQYIELIRQLTNQNLDNNMQSELIHKILSSPDNLSSFFELQSVTNAVHDKIIGKWKTDVESMANSLKLDLNYTLSSNKKWQGFTLFGNEDLKALNVQIYFEFEMFPKSLKFGFFYEAVEGKPAVFPKNVDTLRTLFLEAFGTVNKHYWWACYAPWENMNAAEVCTEIYFGTINEKIRDYATRLLQIAKQCNSSVI